jgi:glycosyltransferase involved in cell wall biosynthesis
VEATRRAAVIIPTHNRIELLKKTLDALLAQTLKAEIFVMDDASSDQTSTIIPRDYPQVRYYREETAHGPTFQRNKAASLTDAQIIFTIDDDCLPTSPKVLEETVAAFDHPRIAAVTLPFVNVLRDKGVHSAAPGPGTFASYDYYGGMVALRRDLYLAAGGYRENFYMHVEEQDLTIRLLADGYVVKLGTTVQIEHHEPAQRDRPALDRSGSRNAVLFSFYHVPWPYFPVHLLGTVAVCIRRGFSIGHPFRATHGLLQGFAAIVPQWRNRKPVSREIYKLSRELKRRGNMPLQELEQRLPPAGLQTSLTV